MNQSHPSGDQAHKRRFIRHGTPRGQLLVEPWEALEGMEAQLEDIRTAAHSPKGDKAYPRHSVEDERPSNAVRHIPIGWGDERGVTRHCLSLLTTTKRNEHPPQPSTIGHEDPPPGSTVDDEGPLASTKPTTRIDERLRGPITTIDEGPSLGSINGYDHP